MNPAQWLIAVFVTLVLTCVAAWVYLYLRGGDQD